MKQFLLFFSLIFFLFLGNKTAFAGAYNPDGQQISSKEQLHQKLNEKMHTVKEVMQKLQKKAIFAPKKEAQRSHNYLGGALKAGILSLIFYAITFVTAGTLWSIMIACSVIALTVAIIFLGFWLYTSI